MLTNETIVERPFHRLTASKRGIVAAQVECFLDYVALKRLKVDAKLSKQMFSGGKRPARLTRKRKS